MVEQSWWNSYGGLVTVEQSQWNSDGGTIMLEQSWWNSHGGGTKEANFYRICFEHQCGHPFIVL